MSQLKKIVIIYSLTLNVLISQNEPINITAPRNNQVFSPKKYLSIEWETNLEGMLKIEYNIKFNDWITIEKDIEISDGIFNVPIDEIFTDEKIPINKDGNVNIRLSKSLNRSEVKIKIPEYASHGSVTFFTTKNKKSKEKIQLIIDGKDYKIDEKLLLPKGINSYKSEIPSYGSSSGDFVIQSGENIREEIRIEKIYGNITVNSNMENIDIMIYHNGRYHSKDSLIGIKEKSISLKEGNYNLKVTKSGYRSKEHLFTINPKKDIKYNMKLIPQHGSLTVNSYPQGAKFTIEDLGIFNKTTPDTIDSVAIKLYKVNFSLADHEEISDSKLIRDNFDNEIFVTLKKHTGFLVLRKINKKQKFNLKIDGVDKVEQNNKRSLDGGTYPLDVGIYKINIEEDGYMPIVKEINIHHKRFERIDLERIPIKVDVTLDPYLPGYDMTLFSSNEEYDNVPIKESKDVQKLPYGKYQLLLPYGKYKIKSNFAKHESDNHTFRIKSPDPITESLKLNKKTSTKAFIFSAFPGAGLLYAEKKRTAITFFGGTILSSLFTYYTYDKYSKKEADLTLLQKKYIQSVELEDIEKARVLRNKKQEEVNDLFTLRNQSILTSLSIYVLSVGVTWTFNGL